ncbi:MAG: hypothetical protein GVY29_10120 [Spirochaetes bacterium]|jgi:two-component sensor histidine kinase|nr:hypothetical protein [Spirochaetota bacterium]
MATFDNEGNVTGWRVALMDVTDRRRAEEADRRAAEQEILTREVHHRIKNDMRLISSFLYLEKDQADNPETAAALDRARSRVNVIQHVYHALQQRDVDDRVTARDVVENALHAHRHTVADAGIALETSLSDTELSSKTAVSLGLIANELGTNALKYAFAGAAGAGAGPSNAGPSDAAGHLIRVTLRHSKSDTDSPATRLQLVVADNGCGFPESVVTEGQRGFGLSVVETLASQHNGTIRLSNAGPDGGAHVEVFVDAE